MKAADGEKMGKYWVVIKVGGGAPAPAGGPFAVTSVNFSTPPSPIDLVCPGNVTVTAAIKTNTAGNVTYKWEDCEGNTESGSLSFASAETKSVSHTFSIGFTATHWASLYIDAPNHQWFGPKNFDVICNP